MVKYVHVKSFEDTKGLSIIRNSKKDIKIMAKMKRKKMANNDLHNTTHKTKD